MENGSNYFLPCSWDGEERKWSSRQGTISSKRGLHSEPWPRSRGLHKCKIASESAPCWKQGIVCAGVRARQGRVTLSRLRS